MWFDTISSRFGSVITLPNMFTTRLSSEASISGTVVKLIAVCRIYLSFWPSGEESTLVSFVVNLKRSLKSCGTEVILLFAVAITASDTK